VVFASFSPEKPFGIKGWSEYFFFKPKHADHLRYYKFACILDSFPVGLLSLETLKSVMHRNVDFPLW
jgi:hypothetical protein